MDSTDDKTINPELEELVDVYRDTSVRYLGYANEVGESFRAIIGSTWVLASYGLATAYVLADTADKTLKTYNETENNPNRLKLTAYTGADTVTWQMLASVAIPGVVINRTCSLSNYLLKKFGGLPQKQRRALVTVIGLSTIPFIIHPIDKFVDVLLDNSMRKYKPL